MQLNDDVLCRAATLVRDRKMNALSEYEAYPEHEFSEAFETELQEIMNQLGKGEIKPYKVSMGWQYYARHGLVAVLVCFLLTCIAAPQAVMAGYHKLIEVIETVVTEYTEYRYQVNETVDDTLQQVTFGYLPEGMEITEESLNESLYYVLYQGNNRYFCLEQRLLLEDTELTQIIDTEDAHIEQKQIQSETVVFSLKDGVYNYVWLYKNYQISGISNLSVEEMIEILESIQYGALHHNAEHQMNKVLFGYLPEGMEIVKERNTERSYHVEYETGDKYFALEQRLIGQDNNLTYVVDTENAVVEKDKINGEEIIYVYKDGIYNYVWIHENYHMKGDSNLELDEIKKILEHIK